MRRSVMRIVMTETQNIKKIDFQGMEKLVKLVKHIKSGLVNIFSFYGSWIFNFNTTLINHSRPNETVDSLFLKCLQLVPRNSYQAISRSLSFKPPLNPNRRLICLTSFMTTPTGQLAPTSNHLLPHHVSTYVPSACTNFKVFRL